MQTYLPYADFEKTAKCLDNKRLGCQRKECLQILQTLQVGPYQCYSRFLFSDTSLKPATKNEYLAYLKGEGNCSFGHVYRKTPWYNHPAVQMWKGYEQALIEYADFICFEWASRGFEENCRVKLTQFETLRFPIYPHWLGNEKVHVAYRSNLLRKNPQHYRQFWPNEPDNLPYYWPTKNIDKPQ